jgi:predicted HTH domain antitoxin
MSVLQLELDDSIVSLLRSSNRPADQAAREMITLELYRRGLISSGKAAEVLGMDRFEFVRHASRLGIPFFDMTPDEWAAEVERLDAIKD